jgi:methoxymalonate biosynthesis protein
MIKCVVWDLDNTLLSGVYLEAAGEPPAADPAILAVAAELGRRGIIHALASKNPPEAAAYAAHATGLDFAATECGWGRKSDAVRRIVADLGLAADAVAFVDDDPYQRAEVSFALPEVLVLAPADMTDAVTWPEFSPAVVTAEARRRGEMYAQRRRRQQEAREFAGSRQDFLRYCSTKVTISPAEAGDLPRLHELAVRTHQFNSSGKAVSEEQLRLLIGSPAHRVVAVRLSDRFGDDGLVGAAVVDRGEPGTWTVTLLMMSCRAIGRGVIEALLGWLCRAASGGGADQIAVPCVIGARNVPLRLALAAAGLRAAEGEPAPSEAGGPERAAGGPGPQEAGAARRAVFRRPLAGPGAGPLPEPPGWVAAPAEP